MGLTFTILAGVCQIGVIIFGVLAYNSDNKGSVKSQPGNIFNITGDYVNRDKDSNFKQEPLIKKDKSNKVNSTKTNQEHVLNKEKIKENNHKEKSDVSKTPSVNNGIINSGINYGNQTVNNLYNRKEESRQLNNQDIEFINSNIPLDYKIIIDYVNSTQESINYTEQIYAELKKIGYNIISVNSIGMLIDGIPNNPGDRYFVYKNDSEKTIKIVIKEQK